MPRLLLRWYWAFRILWQGIGGRWYVFRDAPDWVCTEWISLDDHEDAEIRALSRQAFDELELRIANLQRRILRNAAEIERNAAEDATVTSTTPTSETP